MRANRDIAILEARMSDLYKKSQSLSKRQSKWLARLAAAIDVRAGRLPDDTILQTLPDHVLFRAAVLAEKNENAKLGRKLLKQVSAGNSGWSKLAKTSEQIAAMEQRFKEMKQILEGMK